MVVCMKRAADPHNLARFVRAQNSCGTYWNALAELRAGRKVSHWIWYVMPRLTGTSTMSQYYGLGTRWAARAYLKHPVLGPRLLRCVEAVLANRGRTLLEIFGDVDEAKVRECAELFSSVANADAILFLQLLCKK